MVSSPTRRAWRSDPKRIRFVRHRVPRRRQAPAQAPTSDSTAVGAMAIGAAPGAPSASWVVAPGRAHAATPPVDESPDRSERFRGAGQHVRQSMGQTPASTARATLPSRHRDHRAAEHVGDRADCPTRLLHHDEPVPAEAGTTDRPAQGGVIATNHDDVTSETSSNARQASRRCRHRRAWARDRRATPPRARHPPRLPDGARAPRAGRRPGSTRLRVLLRSRADPTRRSEPRARPRASPRRRCRARRRGRRSPVGPRDRRAGHPDRGRARVSRRRRTRTCRSHPWGTRA